MAVWTQDQASRIQRAWQRNEMQMWLSMACPNCGHEGAFRHVSVSAISVNVGDSGATRNLGGQSFFDDIKTVFQKSPSIPMSFPEHYVVSCGCKDPMHDPLEGCGAEGAILTAVLGS